MALVAAGGVRVHLYRPETAQNGGMAGQGALAPLVDAARARSCSVDKLPVVLHTLDQNWPRVRDAVDFRANNCPNRNEID